MITLALHNETHIALRNSYQHKDAIKALASYPDVQWSGDVKAWLIDVGLLDKLYDTLGDSIAPASPAFWCECPLPTQATYRRRTKQQIMAQKRIKQQAAAQVGGAIIENKESMRWP
jgi:hypothetical protein